MDNKKIPTALGASVLVIIAITAGAFIWAYERNQSMPIARPFLLPHAKKAAEQQPAAETVGSYTNEKYGFSFEFPKTLEITSKSDDAVVLNDPRDGHWAYEVKAFDNTERLTLKDALRKMLEASVAPEHMTAAKVYEGTINGRLARKFTYEKPADYGNTGVVMANETYILELLGDDSTPDNKATFEKILASLKFGN